MVLLMSRVSWMGFYLYSLSDEKRKRLPNAAINQIDSRKVSAGGFYVRSSQHHLYAWRLSS